MDPIDSLNPVLGLLRRQLAENIARLRKSGKLAAGHSDARQAARGEGLEAALRRRLSAVDRRSAEGRLRATRAFVESVLVAEFGEALLSDPGLGEMLDQISVALREEAQLRDQLDNLLAKL